MKKILIISASLAIFALTFSSCKDDEDDKKATPTPTKTELLTAKAWKLTASVVTPSIVFLGVDFSNLYTSIPTCERDNTQKFNAGGAGITDEGASKCATTDPQTTNFIWSFLNNETQLIVDGDTLTVTQLDATTLKLASQTDDVGIIGATPGQKYTITNTFVNN